MTMTTEVEEPGRITLLASSGDRIAVVERAPCAQDVGLRPHGGDAGCLACGLAAVPHIAYRSGCRWAVSSGAESAPNTPAAIEHGRRMVHSTARVHRGALQ